MNGDGWSDVIVGASSFSADGVFFEGQVLVFLGSASGPSVLADWAAQSDEFSAGLGFAVSSGDVNGDGFADVVASAPMYHSLSEPRNGQVFVYVGECYDSDGDDHNRCSGPTLTSALPGIANRNNAWELTNGPAGVEVVWLWSARLGSTPAHGCVDLDVGLDAPRLLGKSVTDADGRARVVKGIPAIAQGKTMHVRGFLPNACLVSNVATTSFDLVAVSDAWSTNTRAAVSGASSRRTRGLHRR